MTLIEEIERLRDAATPGLWRREENSTLLWGHSTPIEDGFHERMGTPILESDRKYRMWGRDIDDDEHIANLELTATLRNNLPTIIAALKAAEQAKPLGPGPEELP